MPQRIGHVGNSAWTWAERTVLYFSPSTKKTKTLSELTVKLGSFSDRSERMDVPIRKMMEKFFGYSLENVCIHYGYQAEEASRRLGARAFTFNGQVFGPRQNLDTSTVEGMGLLAHELTHVIQQTQPSRLPQEAAAGCLTSSVPAASNRSHFGTEMVLLAPAGSTRVTTNPQLSEAQAQASEQSVTEALTGSNVNSPPQINCEEVANRVYCLMQRDLALERERAARLGGKQW